MESKISEKLGELDTLLAKSKEDRTRVETVRKSVDEVYSKVAKINDDLKLSEELCEQLGIPLPVSKQEIDDTHNQMADLNSEVFEMSKKLLETTDQLNAFISELEEKREQIEKSKTLEELEGISLGTPVVIDSVLLSEASARVQAYENAVRCFNLLCRRLLPQTRE